MRRTRDGRDLPPDLGALGIRSADAQVLVEYVDDAAELLALTYEEIRRYPRLGPPGAARIAKACERAGYPLGCVAPVSEHERTRRALGLPFTWSDSRTWPEDHDGARPETWCREAWTAPDMPVWARVEGAKWRRETSPVLRVVSNG